MAYFFKPPKKWAIIKDCGEFPCTGPLNTIYSFKGTKFEGNRPSYVSEDFQIIPNTPMFSKYIKGC